LVRSVRPEDLEMPLSGFSYYITPIEHFFVRTHVYVPAVNANEWRLKVEGEVAAPVSLTMEDLKKLPAVELVSVVECAGNGRGFYQPPVPGVQWTNGSVGNGRWRGVRLADVLKRAGIKDSAKEILFDGADVPLGTMPDFQRSIPVKKALDGQTLLAYAMNGETLPVKHGFPLRVGGARLGQRFVGQVADVHSCARQGTRRILDEERLPASGKAGRTWNHRAA